jgi:hypothetical protein
MSTLVDSKEVDADVLMSLGHEELLSRAKKLFPTRPIKSMSTQELANALSQLYRKDLAGARRARKEMLMRELYCRGVAAIGSFKQLTECLRAQVSVGTRHLHWQMTSANRSSCEWRN